MTKLGRATEYGSFERGCKDINFADDITEKNQCGRRAETFFAHPLNRALIVLVMFVALGVVTLIADRTSVAEANVATTQRSGKLSRTTVVGCEVELGLRESQLTLYHVNAPWEALIVTQKWDLPVGAEKVEKDGSFQLEQALEKSLSVARAAAGQPVVFANAKLSKDARTLPVDTQQAVRHSVDLAITNAGFKQCDGWQRGECNHRRNRFDWAAVDALDKDARKWFTNAITNVDEWRDTAKTDAEQLRLRAVALKAKAKADLAAAVAEARKELEQTKETVQEATEKLRGAQNTVSKRRGHEINDRQERKLEKELRDAENKYEHLTQLAERKYDTIEREAEDLLRRAERDLDEVDRKADSKLSRLKGKAEGLAKKSKHKKVIPTPQPHRGPVPAAAPTMLPPTVTEGESRHGHTSVKNARPQESVEHEKEGTRGKGGHKRHPWRSGPLRWPSRKPELAAVRDDDVEALPRHDATVKAVVSGDKGVVKAFGTETRDYTDKPRTLRAVRIAEAQPARLPSDDEVEAVPRRDATVKPVATGDKGVAKASRTEALDFEDAPRALKARLANDDEVEAVPRRDATVKAVAAGDAGVQKILGSETKDYADKTRTQKLRRFVERDPDEE